MIVKKRIILRQPTELRENIILAHDPSLGAQMAFPYMTGVVVFHHRPSAVRPQALYLDAVSI